MGSSRLTCMRESNHKQTYIHDHKRVIASYIHNNFYSDLFSLKHERTTFRLAGFFEEILL